jgi:hypothetical protein
LEEKWGLQPHASVVTGSSHSTPLGQEPAASQQAQDTQQMQEVR